MRVIAGFDPEDPDQVPIVPYVPPRCPICERSRTKTYGQEGRIRYHKCLRCGRRYRSREMLPHDVKGWESMPG